MTCSDRSYPPCTYCCFTGDASHVTGFGGEDSSVVYVDALFQVGTVLCNG
jgi:hypothetical protein